MRSFGRDPAGYALRDPEKIIKYCDHTPETLNYRSECIIGAVNVIIDFWGQDLKNQASDLCKLTAGKNKNNCYDSLIGRLGGLFKESNSKLELCGTMESPYKERCSSAYKQSN